MFNINNKDTRTTTPCSSVSIVNFEQVNTGWAPSNARKQLSEPLILSKLDYCNIICKDLLRYKKIRMEKLLQACAEFVKHKCENIEQKENMPEHLQFVLKEPTSVL